MKLRLFIYIFFFTLATIQSVLACSSPIVYNEYGVPVSLYGGGMLIINASKYPSNQKIITYNMQVKNTNNYNSITLTLTPSSSLLNYVYGSTVTIPPKWKSPIGIDVYIDGPSKGGELYVTGQCDDGLPIPEGVIYVSIIGRGNSAPQSCGNTITSCGVYPDCQDISKLNGCYDGYYRNYYCANNMIQYNKVCTSYCCQSFTGDGYCMGNPLYCYDPTPSCRDECDFEGTRCVENKVYTCIKQPDGCYDKILLEDCSAESLSCYLGQCINGSSKMGTIAYLCGNNQCYDGLETNLINWLDANGWMIVGKAFNSWDKRELDEYDIILCSDELRACKIDSKHPAYFLHKDKKKPFVEVADYREAQAAWKLGYVKNPYEYLLKGKSLYVTKTEDAIFLGLDQKLQLFSSDKKFTLVPDYNLNSVIDLADLEADNKRSTLFKVEETGTQGRFVYIGWFYESSVYDLSEIGINILNRTLLWAKCGDECLLGSIGNLPPVAKAKVMPNPTGYEGQTIIFDASDSYDPEGNPLRYYWDFGDGTNSGWISETMTTHVYNRQGQYQITLIVNDGELNSKPEIKILIILPKIKNRVAFVCGDNSCNGQTESEIIQFLSENGYYVGKKPEYYWNQEELLDYDFIVCSSSSGCSIHLKTNIYNSHMNNRKGFLEISDYRYARAASTFKYVSWYVGTTVKDTDIILSNHRITDGLSGSIYNTNKEMVGILTSSVKVPTIAKLDYKQDLSTMFVSESDGTKGRYAFIGWLNRNSISDLTIDGKTLLLRTIRWVQCGSVDECG
jgi:RNase P/RNase MRP subunit p29